MKIENVQSIKSIPDKQQPQFLKQGEFFVSEVMEIEGDTALLRTSQGMVLTARLLGDLGLAAGDHVETVVDEAGVSRYVLRLVDISRGGQTMPEAGGQNTATGAQNLRTQMLYSTLAMLKKNAGMDPKTAEFMAKNGIAATPENIETLGRLAEGPPRVAQMLTQMNADIISIRTGAENTAAVAISSELFIAEGLTDIRRPSPEAGLAEAQLAGLPGTPPQTAAAVQNPVMPQQAASLLYPEEAATVGPEISAPTSFVVAAPPVISGQKAPDETDLWAGSAGRTAVVNAVADQSGAVSVKGPVTVLPDEPVAVMTTAPAKMPAAAPASMPAEAATTSTTAFDAVLTGAQIATIKTSAAEPYTEPFSAPLAANMQRDAGQESVVLLRGLMSLFADVEDKGTLSIRLKKAVEELPNQIKGLKISLQSTDNNNRNTVAQRAENLDRQFSMMSDIKRFDCYHVPLTNPNGAPATAELYVYRQRRRKTDEQPESYAVLLGLDTQNMGRVETMIRALGHSVTLEFRLEEADLCGAFAEGAKRLEPLIAQAGYRLSDVSVRRLDTRTTVLNAEETLNEGKASDTGGLDIRI